MKRILIRTASSLRYNNKRSILVIIWFFILLLLLALVTLISLASAKQVSDLNKTVGNAVIVEKIIEDSSQQDPFSSRDIETFTKHPSVETYNAVGVNSGMLVDVLPVVKDRQDYEDYKKRVENRGFGLDDCLLFGLADSNAYTLFTSAGFTLAKGEPITVEDSKKKVAIISSLLAKENNVQIGDNISVNASAFLSNYVQFAPLSLTIIGLFNYPEKSSLYEDIIHPQDAGQQPANFIFIPTESLSSYSSSYSPLQLIVYLKGTDQIKGYIAAMKHELGDTYFNAANGGTFTYRYTWDEEWFSTVSKPAQEISNMAKATAIGLSIGILVIILLIFALLLNSKKYEMGIFLTLGESKTKIVIQTVFEELTLLIVALILACSLSIVAAPGISQIVMDKPAAETNAAVAQKREDVMRHQYYGEYPLQRDIRAARTTYFYVNDEVDISGSIGTFMIFVSAGIVVIITTLVGQALFFLRKSPMKLLITK